MASHKIGSAGYYRRQVSALQKRLKAAEDVLRRILVHRQDIPRCDGGAVADALRACVEAASDHFRAQRVQPFARTQDEQEHLDMMVRRLSMPRTFALAAE